MQLRPNHERFLFSTLSLLVLCYAVLRAKLIPITIDEVSTVVNHATRSVYDIITYRADATPNNHVLHTLLVNFFTWLFGHHHVVVRIPAILGGILYLWAAHRMAALGQTFWIRLFTWIVLLGNPYLIEFFSLARGYSLGAGAMLTAIYFSVRYLDSRAVKDIGLALFWGILAVESNFTLLNFFAPFVVLLLLASKDSKKTQWVLHWSVILGGVVVLAALCYTPIAAMRATNQFVFWGNEGFYKETLLELVRTGTRNADFAGPDTRFVLAWAVILIAVTGWVIALIRWWKRGFRLDMSIMVSGAFAGTFIVNMLQHYLLATPFLNARTALFYYPLFALQLMAMGQWIWEKWRNYALVFAIPVAWLLGVNFYRCYNLSNAYEWWFDAGTFKAIHFLEALQKSENHPDPYALDTNWPNFNSFMYHIQMSTPHYEPVIALGKWHPAREFPRDTEFYYTDSDDEVQKLNDAYEVVMVIPDTGLRLLRKREK
jgi:hypothetical protein